MINFSKDETGAYKRILLESSILSTETIIKLQKRFLDIDGFIPYSPEILHLTIFHLGKPQSLFNEIKVIVPSIQEIEFFNQIPSLLEAINSLALKEFSLALKDFSKFNKPENPQTDIVGLELTTNKEVLELRKEIASRRNIFLKSLGIKDSELNSFIQSSLNLKYSDVSTFRPHISIGTIMSGAQLPELNQTGHEIQFSKPEWVNVFFTNK